MEAPTYPFTLASVEGGGDDADANDLEKGDMKPGDDTQSQ